MQAGPHRRILGIHGNITGKFDQLAGAEKRVGLEDLVDKQIGQPAGAQTGCQIVAWMPRDSEVRFALGGAHGGMKNVRYQMIPGTLVEKARNEAVRMMLRENHGWMLFVDGDMIFAPDSLHRLQLSRD